MGFESINEIDQFSFDDCVIKKFEVQEGQLYLELEALIVKARNSQNTNFTESYAGPTTVRLKEGSILSGIKEGYKYYDANGTLLEETPDRKLTDEELQVLPKQCEDVYLFSMEKDKEEDGKFTYYMEIEFPSEDEYDNAITDTFELKVEFEKAVFSWEFYMNRVEN
ncbi:MAG: hypothetical protein Q4E73_04545 [Lachnospiraceae bacterium]|nr:hypothetical protein [Lachnospiraceae bacterium]